MITGGVLDLFDPDSVRVHPWNHLCCLYHNQVIISIFCF
ncbi:hypothetical protein LINPERPRIM_LOCUS1565 [Linum perenne]